MADEDFALVESESLLPWPCSPRIEDDPEFRGIRIVAPQRVIFRGKGAPRVMVCGGYHLPLGYAGLAELEHGVWLIATDIEHDRVFVAPAVRHGGEPTEHAPAPPPTANGATVLEYFNVDIGRATRMPPQTATWFVYAIIGEAVSNVVAIELDEER